MPSLPSRPSTDCSPLPTSSSWRARVTDAARSPHLEIRARQLNVVDAALDRSQLSRHHRQADAQRTPDPVPCCWRRSGPIKLASDSSAPTRELPVDRGGVPAAVGGHREAKTRLPTITTAIRRRVKVLRASTSTVKLRSLGLILIVTAGGQSSTVDRDVQYSATVRANSRLPSETPPTSF